MKTLYLLLIAFLINSSLSAQDEGFIYGKIYTADNRTYEGPIRWGKEEVFWVDLFNASKRENENLRYLSDEQIEDLHRNRAWGNEYVSSSTFRWLGIGSRYGDRDDNDFVHQFSCQFGDIKSMRRLSSKRFDIELQSGIKVEIDGDGYNDIGTDLKVIDKEIGEMEIEWRSIDRIEFMSTPSRLAQKFGEPLYGTVESYGGAFTGYIQWDKDERLSSDKLDGYSEDGKVALMFDKISSIERSMSRCQVVLKSGRNLELRGTNDVDSDNRGVIVTNENGMMVTVPWDEFKKVTFKTIEKRNLIKYENFKSQKELAATVITRDGKSLTGKLILDLDEQYDFELYQGKDRGIDFSVPLRNIKRIVVAHGEEAEVFLTTGEKLSLEDSQDVGELNQGLLVFTDGTKPVYISWENVKEIQFN